MRMVIANQGQYVVDEKESNVVRQLEAEICITLAGEESYPSLETSGL